MDVVHLSVRNLQAHLLPVKRIPSCGHCRMPSACFTFAGTQRDAWAGVLGPNDMRRSTMATLRPTGSAFSVGRYRPRRRSSR